MTNLQTQFFNALLGEQQGVGRLLLPDIHSAGGSLNITADKLGRVRKISGYATRSTTALPTGATNLNGAVVGLYAFRKLSTDYDRTWIAVVGSATATETAILTSIDDGVTWTQQVTGAYAPRLPPGFAQIGDTVYISNGLSNNAVNYTVTRSGSTVTVTPITASASPTITATASATEGKLNGTYKWRLVAVNNTTGARKDASVDSNVLTLTNVQADLAWTADADTAYGGYELYRTTGTGNLFYFVTYIDGRATVAYTDNNLDTDIYQSRILAEHGDVPPAAFYVTEHNGRLWWFNGTHGYWADAGRPTSVYPENYLRFDSSPLGTSVIRGAMGNFNDTLAVFNENAIFSVTGTGAVVGRINDWTSTRTNARAGATSWRSIVRVPAGARYLDASGSTITTPNPTLAFFTPYGDIRLFDGDGDEIISLPVVDTLTNFNYASRKWVHAIHDAEHNQIRWFIPTNSSTYPDTALVWNYLYGIWFVHDGQPFTAAVTTDTSTDPSVIAAGLGSDTSAARIVTVDSGTDREGVPFAARWLTKPLFGSDENGFPLISLTKRWRWVDVHGTLESAVPLTVEWIDAAETDLITTALGSRTVTSTVSGLYTSTGDSIVTDDDDTIAGETRIVSAKVRLTDTTTDYPHTTGLRIRLSDGADSGDWILDGLTVAYQILPGQKRRMDES